MPKSFNNIMITLLSLWLMLMAVCTQAALTPAGTVIMAQATATFFDTKEGEPVTVLSNQASLTVAPVAAMTLEQNQSQTVAAGQQVVFIHRLTHRGNTPSQFQIEVTVGEGAPVNNLHVYEYKGALPAPSTEPITLTRPMQPDESMELVVIATAPSIIGATSTLVLSALSMLDNTTRKENHDTLTTGEKAARLTKQVNKTEAKPGELLSYQLSIRNMGEFPLPERQLTVDGSDTKGLLLEDKIPVYTHLDPETTPTVIPIQAKSVVRTLEGKRWISFDQWDKKETITRIGLLIPADKLATGQPATLSFSAKIETTAKKDTLIRNEGFLTESDNNLPWLTSNQVVTRIQDNGKEPSDTEGALRFTTPSSIKVTPDFHHTFNKTGYYYLMPDSSRTQHDVYLELKEGGFRTSTEQADTVDVKVQSATGDSITVKLIETGPDTGLFRSQLPLHLMQEQQSSNYCGSDGNTPDYSQQNKQCLLTSKDNDQLTATATDPESGKTYRARAGVSPQGTIFDTDTQDLATIPGAEISFLDINGKPALNRITGRPVYSQITGDDGSFGYPPLIPGDYFIHVTPPQNYTFPSAVPKEKLAAQRHVTDASYGPGGVPAETTGSNTKAQASPTAKGSFHVSDDSHLDSFDVPLDPSNSHTGLTLQKEAKQKTIAPGELAAYELTLKNATGVDLYNLHIKDNLPLGFKYMKGSARINDKPVNDPDGDFGPQLTFKVQTSPAMAAGDEMKITYALKAGAGAIDGDGINRATATAKTFPAGLEIESNQAQAQVSVKMDGVLSDKAILFGKIYVDSNCSGIQDKGEWPMGGVRLYMEDGTWAITDENGQYSLMGLKPGNHVIKVDPITLPDGLVLKPLDNRNAADGNSRFADLSPGEMHRADFAAMCPATNYTAIFEQIKERNKKINGDWLLDDAAQYSRSKPTEKADNNGDLSHGVVRGPTENSSKQDKKKKATTDDGHKTAEDSRQVLAKMPLAEKAVKTITNDQAIKGTWLWPQKQKADGRFMAVVRAGVKPKLYVNDEEVSRSRLGEQLINNREQAQLMGWYGVLLKDGENTVEIKATDFFGNERVLAKGTFIQSGAAQSIQIKPQAETLAADEGRSLLPVTLRMLDNNGQPASGVYFVTLESTAGTWQEPDIQDKELGHQVRIDQGEITVHLRSGGTTGPVTLKASTGDMQAKVEITQVAAPRPLVAVGLVDINTSHGSVRGAASSLDEIANGTQTEKRVATFVKGEIAKDTQLTLSYDSDKNDNTELFRDVDPDDYYPITGDASQKGYEAQSRSKLYAKIEKDRSSIMWGDYQTDTNSSENDLAKIQRSLTGVNGIYDNGKTRVQGFAAQSEDQHISEIIEPNGTAMNYRLKRAPIVRNSEVLVLETLDQKNGIVLKTRNLSRGTDYTLDEFSGYLKFTSPMHRLDEEGNLQQIRASYDLEGDGEAYTLAGARVQQKINDNITVGGSYTHNDHKTEGSELGGAWVEYKPSENTTVAVSGAHMTGKAASEKDKSALDDYSGNAARINVKQKWNNQSETEVTWARADTGFKNSGGGVSEGREETRLQHKQQVTAATDVRSEVEVSRSLDESKNSQGDSIGAFVDHKIGDGWKLTAGSRYIRQRSDNDQESYATGQVGAEKQFKLLGKDASITAEYEKALSNNRWRTAVESNWKINDKISLYGRFNRDDSLSPSASGDSKNDFSFGLKSDWIPNTKTYSEYRMRGATDGKNLEWVNGAETSLELVKGFSISPSVEWIDTVSGNGDNDGLAVSMGFQDKRFKDQRANGRIEYRDGKTQNYYGFDTAIARRLSLDWSGLIREEFRLESPKIDDKSKTQKHAMTAGLARRPKLDNVQHGLYLYQWKEERGQNEADNRTVHLISTHQNRQINSDLILTGRMGSKWVSTALENYRYDSQTFVSDARVTWDIDRRWDIDLRGGVLAVDGTDSMRWSAGFGAYYLVARNLRVGAYYNFVGFSDKDLDSQEYNAEGIHLSMQFKFDESIFDWFTS